MVNNQLFGGVYYINLEHRIDRKDECEKELDNVNIIYERFNAIKHDIGIIGCGLSGVVCAERFANILNKKVLILNFECCC